MLAKFLHPGVLEAGCDEAGRGCLAGPVVAGAVILPSDFEHPFLNDSKQLTEKQRDDLRPFIEKHALAWAVGVVDNIKIDEINILNASFLAMHKAIDRLKVKPQSLLIDGNRFKKYKKLPHHCIIKGDSLYQSIAAASILAKTHRDEMMQKLHKEFPYYKWNTNKAYATLEHREGIAQFGECKYHRKSFRLMADTQLELELG